MTAPRIIDGAASLLLIADHASNAVPPGIDLGLDPALMTNHIAIDIGTEALTLALAAMLDAPAVIATVSRLVIDLNREPDAPGLVPFSSDGHVINGNVGLTPSERELRIAAIHTPYHTAISTEIDARAPRLLVSIHSFTPQLATDPAQARPWPVGILYNLDDRAAVLAIDALEELGVMVGDNEPYSGRILNATMNRHAEARGIPYIGFEVRQDLIGTETGIVEWAARLAGVVMTVYAALTPAP
jgi:predicted N-formylglutamate amidohydrolase